MSFFHLLDKDGQPCEVAMEDIIAIKPTSRGPEFHTSNEVYYYPSTMEEFQILLSGQGFERLDRVNLVNMSRIKGFDPKARKVYFEYPWTAETPFATVSEANVHKVIGLVKEQEDKSYGTNSKPAFWKRKLSET
ncbi:LytTR family transcriptional regulator DNA-binding domain-containing protein [Cohnella lubricantis]|nr:LytTR family transcriptional regulator DNA-binding domain-containing protein [Cohnella lubricantis]MBP2116676.1 DNA-binding LytR/AlgR family response regulator [Cohnella lubricantis]